MRLHTLAQVFTCKSQLPQIEGVLFDGLMIDRLMIDRWLTGEECVGGLTSRAERLDPKAVA